MGKILVVDDSKQHRKMLRLIFKKMGHQVIAEAENSEEAMACYLECNPDLVSMDFEMPKINGIKCAECILQIDPQACIVMISGSNHEGLSEKASESGISAFIKKPFKAQQLSLVINTLLAVKIEQKTSLDLKYSSLIEEEEISSEYIL